MTLTVVWAAAVLVAGATGWLWGLAQTRGPEDDFLTIVDLGVALGGLAVITFVVVSVTLSSVRKAASSASSW